MEKKFNWVVFLRSIASIAIPVALQNLLTTTGTMVDTIMIAPLGETTVGAVGLCAQFSSLMFSCYWGFVGGGMLFFAQYFGAKDDDGIERAYTTTLSFMSLVALIFTASALFFPHKVLALYTDKKAIQLLGVKYLKTVCFAYPFQILSMAMSALLRSTEKVKIPFIASIISVLTNIVFNRVFIYGAFGIPSLREQGAAIATVIAAVVNSAVIIIFAKAIKYRPVFRFKSNHLFNREWMKMYLKKCYPIICNELLIGIGFMVINIVLGRQPEEAIAALAVFRTLEGFVISFFTGFSNASSILVGKAVGAGKLEDSYNMAYRLIYLCGGVIASVCCILLLIHKPILTIMSLSGESYYYGTGMLAVYCVAAVIRMCNWTQNDTFRAAGDASFGTILETSFMYVMVLPCVCISGLVLKLPTLLVFALAYVDEPIRFVLMQIHLYSAKWIKPVTPQGNAVLKEFMQSRIGIANKRYKKRKNN